ncbi:MAG: orotidine-5'-phosphate decarboxylase [Buchnera aphidicola (Nurudea shiraii)]
MISQLFVKKPQIIIALDFSNKIKALKLINSLDPKCFALKIGTIMFTLFGIQFVKELQKKGFRIFLDLKFYDIPNTIFKTIRAIANLGIWMISIHICGGIQMLKSAKLALNFCYEKKPLLMGVTVLTSLNNNDIRNVGVNMLIKNHVLILSKLAKKCNLDGIICPGSEVLHIKNKLGDMLKILTPGIQFNNNSLCDQKNVITPCIAKKYNIDYIVIGRAITSSKNPLNELKKIQIELKNPKQN